MLRLITLILWCVPFAALSHSQTPARISGKVIVTPEFGVKITLANRNAFPQVYEILVNDKVLGEVFLPPQELRELSVILKADKCGLWDTKTIASHSKLSEHQSVRTRITTRVEYFSPCVIKPETNAESRQ